MLNLHMLHPPVRRLAEALIVCVVFGIAVLMVIYAMDREPEDQSITFGDPMQGISRDIDRGINPGGYGF